jgi:hypothetical protein
MTFSKTLKTLVAGLTLVSPAAAQGAANVLTLEEKVSQPYALGITSTGHLWETEPFVKQALQKYHRNDLNLEALSKKADTVPVLALGVTFSVPLVQFYPAGRIAELYTGGFLTVASTRLPGMELEDDGRATLTKTFYQGTDDQVDLPIAIEYDLEGEFTSVTGFGKFGGTLWYGHKHVRLGSRAELAMGGIFMAGEANFLARFRGGKELAEGKFATIGHGLAASGVISPLLLQLYKVECSAGIGRRYHKMWYTVTSEISEPGGAAEEFESNFSPLDFDGMLNVSCLYRLER